MSLGVCRCCTHLHMILVTGQSRHVNFQTLVNSCKTFIIFIFFKLSFNSDIWRTEKGKNCYQDTFKISYTFNILKVAMNIIYCGCLAVVADFSQELMKTSSELKHPLPKRSRTHFRSLLLFFHRIRNVNFGLLIIQWVRQRLKETTRSCSLNTIPSTCTV